MGADSQIHVGADGAEAFIRDFMALDGSSRGIFLVAGRHAFEASGVARALAPLLAGRSATRFSGFSANPEVSELHQALAAFRESGARLILAVGGGSALDLGKLINYFSATGLEPEAYLGGARASGAGFLPLLAIPTTAGSGSEATHFAVLYDGFNKVSVGDPRLVPSHVWLNADFTESLSPYQTACSGFDALAQAIESRWAVGSTVPSRQDSARALELCREHLESAVLRPSRAHRAGMLEAAHLAGRAINVAKTTAAHAMSYCLTAHYGLAHGHAVAMTLPAVFEANAAVEDADLNDPRGVAHVRAVLQDLCVGLGANSPAQAVREIRTLMARIGLSAAWFQEHNLPLGEVRTLVLRDVNQERLGNNPRRLAGPVLESIADQIR